MDKIKIINCQRILLNSPINYDDILHGESDYEDTECGDMHFYNSIYYRGKYRGTKKFCKNYECCGIKACGFCVANDYLYDDKLKCPICKMIFGEPKDLINCDVCNRLSESLEYNSYCRLCDSIICSHCIKNSPYCWECKSI